MSRNNLVFIVSITNIAVLLLFRLAIELGLDPGGSLRVRDIPLEYLLASWFLVFCALGSYGRRLEEPEVVRVATYEWWWTIAGLTATMVLAHGVLALEIVHDVANAYWLGVSCLMFLFVWTSLSLQTSSKIAIKAMTRDMSQLLASRRTWPYLLSAAIICTLAPRSTDVPIRGSAFRRWYSMQPRLDILPSREGSSVTLIRVVDHLCPLSQLAARRYEPVIQAARATYGDDFAVLTLDFPLNSACNPAVFGTTLRRFTASCEVASAARLAREVMPDRELELLEWIWKSTALAGPAVLDGVREHFGLDVSDHYDDLIRAIRQDAAEAARLGVVGTPAFFLNGKRLPLIPAESLHAAIETEINSRRRLSTAADVSGSSKNE